ncbi:thioredoxin family protein [Parabacteroides chinchillae]|uniref:Thioredoxin-like n=1 Tax=Parabacteroides chinchillae TaxID=871327 RepID=A0A8G2F1W1_9BACT|nr:thioredoxin family protein [Parabacteroides chinchillae]SEF55500.1 Thioredoxin-like [Parabacteroides chinchillae]
MKIRTYVLIASVAFLGMSAGSKEAKLTEGVNPGDLAPRIESLGNESDFNFRNHSGRYTLLNFWAAYDAESRARNVLLANEVNKLGSDKIAMRSVSLDEKTSIFTETVKADKLDLSTQFHDGLGKESEMYRKYNLQRGLRNFLINDKGVIVAANVTPEKLTEVLKKI